VLPRLLYIGDVPIEASYHGSALLFRLLQRYPADRLLILEGNLVPPKTTRRLPQVRHAALHHGSRRLLNSRFHDGYSWWLTKRAGSRLKQVANLLDGFSPEAILTVGHGYSWITAARAARALNVPLHLVIHDDWPRVVAPSLRDLVDHQFGAVYRQAATRLCTSPFMADDYFGRYQARGTVLLPYRGVDGPAFSGVADRLHQANPATVFAFAGTINSPGYARLLRQLATVITEHRGELLLFGPIDATAAAAAGLALPNIRLGGLLSSDELLLRLRSDADVLFVPMSFDPADAANMRMGFPSKLTEYTAVGLPLLICGPPDCSAVRWALDNPGVGEVVTADHESALAGAVTRLSTDAAHRIALAERAQAIGARDFAPGTAQAIFHHALQSTRA
jgi:glycosyltransferase involved in cell wall biosynthesis